MSTSLKHNTKLLKHDIKCTFDLGSHESISLQVYLSGLLFNYFIICKYVSVCVCVCVWGGMFMWFIRTQICIMTWV